MYEKPFPVIFELIDIFRLILVNPSGDYFSIGFLSYFDKSSFDCG